MSKLPNHVKAATNTVVVVSYGLLFAFISYALIERTLQSFVWATLLGLITPLYLLHGVRSAVLRQEIHAANIISGGWFMLTIVFAYLCFTNCLSGHTHKSLACFAFLMVAGFLFFSFWQWRNILAFDENPGAIEEQNQMGGRTGLLNPDSPANPE